VATFLLVGRAVTSRPADFQSAVSREQRIKGTSMLSQTCAAPRLVAILLAGLAFTTVANAQVRISQVGKSGSVNDNAYDGQYVELFNAGATEVQLAGKSVQIASSAGSASWTKVDLDGSIAPGRYRLIRISSYYPVTRGIHFVADQIRPVVFNGTPAGNTAMGDSAGKVVLADTTTLFTTAGCAAPDATHVLDLVSWSSSSSTANCHEGSALALVPSLSGVGSTAVLRKCGGQTDTNDNLNDFVSTARPPRNSTFTGAASGPAVNGVTQVTGKTGRGVVTGYAGQTVLFTSTPTVCSGTVSTVTIDLASIGGAASQAMLDNGTNGDAVAGDGVYSYLYTIPSSATAPLNSYILVLTATDSTGLTGTGLAPLNVAPPPPQNDLCSNAQPLPATPLPVSVSAYGNLVSAGPISLVGTGCTTNSGFGGTSRDVWYSFTPVETSFYTISTCNSVTAPGLFNSMSTVLSLLSSCPADDATDVNPQSLTCNANGCSNFIGGGPSTIGPYPMDAGTTYLIRVAKAGSGDSVIGAPFRLDITSEPFGACCSPNGTCSTMSQSACTMVGGTFKGNGTTCSSLTCPPAPAPANDDCSAALVLTTGASETGTTYGASGSDITTCDLTSWDVWYTYTPSSANPFHVTVTLTGGSQTPAIAVFGTCPPVTDANLLCSPVPASGNVNTLDFTGAPGTPYFIRVATNFSQRSDFTVVVTVPSCPADIGRQGGIPGNDGLLDNNDFVMFIDYFFNGNPLADRGVQGGLPGHDGVFDNNDFVVFIDQFFAGC
jgi:hypothetical protein